MLDEKIRAMWPETPAVPVIVAVTGHRNPRPEDEAALRHSANIVLGGLRSALDKFGVAAPLVLASGLAEGADQIVAELRGDIPLIAIAPMPLPDYRETFENAANLSRFEALWREASLRIELPWIGANRNSAAYDAQFEQLGRVLSRHSHVLLALWDGDTARAPKSGGTAQIVGMRRAGEAAPGFSPKHASWLFSDPPHLLELSSNGPVIQIVTPRLDTDGKAQAMGYYPVEAAVVAVPRPDSRAVPASAGDIWWWSDSDKVSSASQSKRAALTGEPVRITSAADVARQLPSNFGDFCRATAAMRAAAETIPELCQQHERFLRPEGASTSDTLAMLGRFQAHVDVAASSFQRKLLGDWSLGLPWADGRKLAASHGDCFPATGAIFPFALAVPMAVFFYEGYAHLDFGCAPLLLYFAVVFGTAAYYLFRVRRCRWQEHFQDYRALAEALRVQFHWAACGIPAAASDNYLRQHADELGWIRQALRGSALLGVAAALEVSSAAGRQELTYWVDYQAAFFVGANGDSGKAAVNKRAQERIEMAVTRIFGMLFALVVGMIVIDSSDLNDPKSVWHKYLVAALGVLPAIAAFPVVIGEGRVYEAHAHAYRRAGRLHRLAKALLMRSSSSTDMTINDLALELGREALAENASWLVSHRERRVANRSAG